MSAKFTPGPWVYAKYDQSERPCVTTVALCCEYVIGLPSSIPGGNYRDGDPSGDPGANARLIAAAPDLLAACVEFVRKCDSGQARSEKSYAQMAAAIQAATGEQA